MNDEIPSGEVHEPVPDLKIWLDGKVKLVAGGGTPIEMEAQDASLVADVLRRLSQPGIPDLPYQPDRTGYGALMHEACVDWGFCGCIKNGRPIHVDDFLPAAGPVGADQFVDWLFLADNLNPKSDPEKWAPHKNALRAAFVRHMGGEIVDARRFDWRPVPSGDEPEAKWRGPLPD